MLNLGSQPLSAAWAFSTRAGYEDGPGERSAAAKGCPTLSRGEPRGLSAFWVARPPTSQQNTKPQQRQILTYHRDLARHSLRGAGCGKCSRCPGFPGTGTGNSARGISLVAADKPLVQLLSESQAGQDSPRCHCHCPCPCHYRGYLGSKADALRVGCTVPGWG